MKTIEIAGRNYSIKGELPNGAFYLEGPRGGSVLFAKPAGDLYMFFMNGITTPIYSGGSPVTATRAALAA